MITERRLPLYVVLEASGWGDDGYGYGVGDGNGFGGPGDEHGDGFSVPGSTHGDGFGNDNTNIDAKAIDPLILLALQTLTE